MQKSPEARMAAALGERSFTAGAAPGPARATAKIVNFPAIKAGDIHVGDAETGAPVGINLVKLLEGRLLIQGASGAGKSWTLRRLLEQSAGLVQQVVIDPEGEFGMLADALQMVRVEGHKLDMATLAIAGARAREHRMSLLLDLSELERDEQMKASTAFINALIAAPREHWHPCLVAVDEAHLFAPFGGYSEWTSVRKASIASLADLMGRGRKRGLAGVLATQRVARIATSVRSEALNFMVGLNTLDVDIRRASDMIGWDASKGFDRLPLLHPGDFVTVGPAFSLSPTVLRVGPVDTAHAGAAPQLTGARQMAPGEAARLLDLDALVAESSADQAKLEGQHGPPGLRQIRTLIRDPRFADAGRIWGALLKVAPDGALLTDLAKHLNRSAEDIAAALELLDLYGTVEFSGDDRKRAARIKKEMLP